MTYFILYYYNKIICEKTSISVINYIVSITFITLQNSIYWVISDKLNQQYSKTSKSKLWGLGGVADRSLSPTEGFSSSFSLFSVSSPGW
jgi:hypothetical protein